MADDSVKLLFELQADSGQVTAASVNAKGEIQKLTNSFRSELSTLTSATKSTFDDITNSLSTFVSSRLPLIGEGFEQVKKKLEQISEASDAPEKHLLKLGDSIEKIADKSGKTEEEVSAFLHTFSGLSTEAEKSAAALAFFGDKTKAVSKELEVAGVEMKAFAVTSAEVKSGFAGILSPQNLAIGGFLAITAAIVGTVYELFELTEKSAAYGEEIFKAHLKTRLSTDTVGALKIAAHEAGESIEGLNIGLLRFGHNLDAANKGNETLAKKLKAEGITAFNDVDKALGQYIDHLGKLETEEAQTESISSVFGARFGARLIEVFHQVGGSLEEFKNELKSTGHIMSEDQVRAAHELTVAHHQLEEEFAAVSRRIGASFIPVLLGITNALKTYPFAFAAAAIAVSLFATALALLQFPTIITAVTTLFNNVVILTQAMFGLTAATEAAAVSTAALTAAWGGVALLAITALVVAFSQYESAADIGNKVTAKQIEEQTKALEVSQKLVDSVKDLQNAQSGSVEQHQKLNDIIHDLDPSTRAYVTAVENEEDRIKRLNLVYERHNNLVLADKAVLISVGAATLDQIQKIKDHEAAIERLNGFINYSTEIIEKNRLAGTSDANIERQIATLNEERSAAIVKLTEEIKKLSKEEEDNAKKLHDTGVALGYNADQFRDVFEKTGETAINVKALGDIYEAFTPKVNENTEKVKQQAEAWERLKEALKGSIDRTELLNQEVASGIIKNEDERKAIEETDESRKIAYEEAKKNAEASKKDATDALRLGKINRDQETAIIIAGLETTATAEKAAIEEKKKQQIDILEKAQKGSGDQAKAVEAANKAIEESNRQLHDVDVKLAQDKKDRLTADLLEERKLRVEHDKAVLANLLAASQLEILIIEDKVKLGKKTAEDGEKERAVIEQAGFKARKQVLEEELSLPGLEISARQKLVDELKKLDIERSKSEEEQAQRRIKVVETGLKGEVEARIQEIQGINKVAALVDQGLIASLENSGKLRIKKEEDVQKAILKIRLDANDRELEELKAKKAPIEFIHDPDARRKAEQQLTNEVQLNAQKRVNIEETGNRDIDNGRKTDLDNFRAYIDKIKIFDAERLNLDDELAKTRVALLKATFASEFKIIEEEDKQRQDAENKKYAAERNLIEKEYKDAVDAAKKAGQSAEELLELQVKYDKLMEDEKKRHDAVMGINNAQTQTAIRQVNAFSEAQDHLNQIFKNSPAALIVATQALAGVQQAANAVGQAIGQMVQSWVLMGNAGGSFKKIAAEIIASIAQQAAVQSIYELAQGLAMLALNFFFPDPKTAASAAAHFQAAAVFGAIAGVAAVAGRGVAGNAFQTSAGGGSATGAGASGGGGGVRVLNENVGGNTPAGTPGRGSFTQGVAQLAQAIRSLDQKVTSFAPGDVLGRGVAQNPHAIGQGFAVAYRGGNTQITSTLTHFQNR